MNMNNIAKIMHSGIEIAKICKGNIEIWKNVNLAISNSPIVIEYNSIVENEQDFNEDYQEKTNYIQQQNNGNMPYWSK